MIERGASDVHERKPLPSEWLGRLAWWIPAVVLFGAAGYALAIATTKVGVTGGGTRVLGEDIISFVSLPTIVVAAIASLLAPMAEPVPRTAVALYCPAAASVAVALGYTWDTVYDTSVDSAPRYVDEGVSAPLLWIFFVLALLFGAAMLRSRATLRLVAVGLVPLFFMCILATFVLH